MFFRDVYKCILKPILELHILQFMFEPVHNYSNMI